MRARIHKVSDSKVFAAREVRAGGADDVRGRCRHLGEATSDALVEINGVVAIEVVEAGFSVQRRIMEFQPLCVAGSWVRLAAGLRGQFLEECPQVPQVYQLP